MASLDPKIFFSNERTFLKWMHTSVTLGSVATGVLGVSSTLMGQGFNPLRIVGLLLLALSIVITAHALLTFHERARLLNMRRTDGFESTSAPVAIALCLVAALTIVYVAAVMKKSEDHVPPPPV